MMLKFRYTKIAGARMMSLAPEKVPGMLRAMKKRATWEGVIISPDAKPGPDGEGQFQVLSLEWYPGFGYEVHFMGLAFKENHFLVTASKLSKPEVYVELGGQGQELWPPELFVPYDLAERAVLHLLHTGKRDLTLSWVGISAFPRKAVAAGTRAPKPSGPLRSDA